MAKLLSEEVAERLNEARQLKPMTPEGLWAQEDAVRQLEGTLFRAYQVERQQMGEMESGKFRQLADFPTILP